MKFGTIGAGAVALAFAREALATGHEVVLSSRQGPESLASKVDELGRGASAATVEAAERAPSLSQLAAAAGLSANHFHRLFKAIAGVTGCRCE